MSVITKPMLAGKCEDVSKLVFPVLATPKLDGIRCLIIDGKAVSRKFKPIPNDHIRTTIESEYAAGKYRAEFDGEIMVRGRTFNDMSGDVRRVDGKPDFYYAVFDKVTPVTPDCPQLGLKEPYDFRIDMLKLLSLPDCFEKVLPVLIKNETELAQYEADKLLLGYEGVMVRSLSSPYKCGRSTMNEGYLLKIKRFEDDEAEIVGYEEEMQNNNVATKDAFGRTERASNKENLVGKGTLGKLIGRNKNWPEDFGIGTGYTADDRKKLWIARDLLVGKIAKFKHQPPPVGAPKDERPRFPVFLGFRDEWDM